MEIDIKVPSLKKVVYTAGKRAQINILITKERIKYMKRVSCETLLDHHLQRNKPSNQPSYHSSYTFVEIIRELFHTNRVTEP